MQIVINICTRLKAEYMKIKFHYPLTDIRKIFISGQFSGTFRP